MIESHCSDAQIGTDRARRAADILDAQALRGETTPFLINIHRDYCGHGLFILDGEYVLAKSQIDGWPTHPLVRISNRASFIEWLAARTDRELAGHGGGILAAPKAGPHDNQRLSCSYLDALMKSHP